MKKERKDSDKSEKRENLRAPLFQIQVGLSVFVVKVRARTSTPIDNRPGISTADFNPPHYGVHCPKMDNIWGC
jgi:hypothetical protein